MDQKCRFKWYDWCYLVYTNWLDGPTSFVEANKGGFQSIYTPHIVPHPGGSVAEVLDHIIALDEIHNFEAYNAVSSVDIVESRT